MPKKTKEVAELLGVRPFNLIAMISAGRLTAPAKDCSGQYVWLTADIDRARVALTVDRRFKQHKQSCREGVSA
jgi:hypothetical protein